MTKNLHSLTLLLGLLIFIFSCEQKEKAITPESVGLSGDTLKLAELRMQEYIDSGKLAGISTLIIKNGVEIQRAKFGYDDNASKKPITDSTIFRIFSMTKPITGVALMILYDEGKFQLDDPVSKYIPEFENTMVDHFDGASHTLVPQETAMTIRHLLTHTSGISYGWDNTYVDSIYRASDVGGWNATIGEKVKILAGLPLNFQPGTQWKYGLSIDVIGYLVEVLSGQPLDEFMQSRLFDPLKMGDTGFYVPEEKHSRLALVYQPTDSGEVVLNDNEFLDRFKEPTTLFSGGGGLVSTIDDYKRFCLMLINGGELNGVRILEPSTVDLIMSNRLPEGTPYTEEQGYGLAGSVTYATGEYSWGGAASTSFTIDPKNDMIIITFTQLMPSDFSYATDFMKIARSGLMDIQQ